MLERKTGASLGKALQLDGVGLQHPPTHVQIPCLPPLSLTHQLSSQSPRHGYNCPLSILSWVPGAICCLHCRAQSLSTVLSHTGWSPVHAYHGTPCFKGCCTTARTEHFKPLGRHPVFHDLLLPRPGLSPSQHPASCHAELLEITQPTRSLVPLHLQVHGSFWIEPNFLPFSG